MTDLSGTLHSYLRQTSRPLANLAFVAPLILAYEAGLLWLGPQAMRSGADVWLRQFLESIGFTQYFLLPAIICAWLLSWHHVSRERWQVRGAVLHGMLLESMLFGTALLFVARCHQAVLAVGPDSAAPETQMLGPAVSYLGAGIYEELFFRLFLLTAFTVIAQSAGASRSASWLLAVAASSLLFAAAHYRFVLDGSFDPSAWGEAFIWSTFVFRFVAGVIFSLLFLFRGFGIAVGAHALYDILVGC